MEYRPPQDVVAIFHASFHPTRGNVLDWQFSTDDDLDVENLGLEFSALPSGLHQLDEDVIYFTANSKHKNTTYYALALFRRRRTSHPLYRGFLLGSLGILVAGPSEQAARATPWKHLPALKDVAERCYSRPGSEPSVLVDIPVSDGEEWFAPAREFFEERRVRGIPPAQAPWTNWKDELHDEVRFWMRSLPCPSHPPSPALTHITPTLALPSILALLGPLSLTLYRHLLTRKRILIYTKPPVEFACVMCYAAVDMVRSIQQEAQEGYTDDADEGGKVTVIPPRHSLLESTRVLGMVTLHDLLGSKFSEEEDSDEDGASGRGWIACTTDALFLEKPSYYDLLIDLTSVGVSSSSTVAFATSKYPTLPDPSNTPSAAPSWMIGPMASAHGSRTRPTMYLSVPKHPIPLPVHIPHKNGSGKVKVKPPTKKNKKEHKKLTHYKRIQTRWAWSDVRLWGELDKVLRVPPSSIAPSNNGDDNTPDNSTIGHGSTGAPTLPTIGGSTSNHECKLCGGQVTKQASTTVTAVSSSETDGSGQEPPPTPGAGIGEKPTSPGTGAGTWLADAWQLYEDVCLVCAGALMGTLRTRNLGTGASGEGDGYFTSGGGSGGATAAGFNLKRSVSTPLYTSGSPVAGKMEYRSITMPTPGHHASHGHTRSVSASVAGEAGRKGLGALLEDVDESGHRESLHLDTDPLQAQIVDRAKVKQPETDHDLDFTLVAPPTADTREGLDMLLNTSAFPVTLAEAVNKTEGVLGVLDGYADWVVGVLRGRVLASVAGAVGVGEGETEERGNQREGYALEGAEGFQQARTSAIELSVTGAQASGGVSSRRSSPPPPSTPAKIGSGISPKCVKNVALNLTPRDLLALDLNPLSATDVKFLEGLVGEYASRAQVVVMGSQSQDPGVSEGSGLGKQPERVTEGGEGVSGKDAREDVQIVEDIHVNLSVKRGWRDLVGVVFGLGS